MRDCETCLKFADDAQRRLMGCGWLPAADHGPDGPPDAWRFGPDRSEVAEVCPGYSCTLPDVVDVATCYSHWEKGQLEVRLGGVDAAPALVDGIEILHAAVGAAARARVKRGRG